MKQPKLQNPFGNLLGSYNVKGIGQFLLHLLQKVPFYVWVFLAVAIFVYFILYMWWFFYRGVKPV